MVRLDYGFVGKGSLLYFAAADGPFDVFGVQDNAHARRYGPATASYDESHAPRHGRAVYGYSLSERPGGVYSHQQRGGNRPAVVFEPEPSAACSGQARAREERKEVVARSRKGSRSVVPMLWLRPCLTHASGTPEN